MISRRRLITGTAAITAIASTIPAPFIRRAEAAVPYPTSAGPLRARTIASGLDHPWSVAFLPDGDFLVTERSGALRRVSTSGKVSAPIGGMPKVVARGQGGLLDVALHPGFADNSLIYLTYSEPGDGGQGTAAAHARFDGGSLTDLQVVFRQKPKRGTNHHFGSRLAFAPDGKLFVTTGDRGDMDEAQNLSNTIGVVVRINDDGTIPTDNPFVGRADVPYEIWSFGHRNQQGAAIHPTTGALWTHEHGARGGDEVNIPQAGRNYGWPVITHGIDYSGLSIGEGSAKEGMEQPVHYWVPSIAPSGMAFLTSDAYGSWKGSLLVGSLKFALVARLTLDGDRVVGEERILDGFGSRIRDVRQGPDGLIHLVTDQGDGRLVRLEPMG